MRTANATGTLRAANYYPLLTTSFRSAAGEDLKQRRESAAFQDEEEEEPDLEGYGGLEQDDMQDLLVFETKKPSWNSRLSAWTLNFSGRVKRASKKNFLLVAKPGFDR